MTKQANPSSPQRLARIAGLLYLIIIVCGLFSEIFVRSSLIVLGNSDVTASNIASSEMLFRAGFVADSFMLFADVAIAIVLYALFKPVSPVLSMTAAAFRLIQAAILGANLLLYYSALLILSHNGYMSSFSTGQTHSLALLFLNIHGHGYDLGLLFFGVSNLVLGYLVIRSRFVPALIGYGLVAAGLVYLLGSYTRFVFPEYLSVVQPVYVLPLVAELSFCLWLLIKGVRMQALR